MMFQRFIGAGVIAASAALGMTATAQADPPNCTAGDLSMVMSGVNAGMGAYLLTHPDVNAYFTSLKGMSRDQMRDAVVAYGQSNPQVQNEIQAIRQPANDFRDRCQAPVPDGMPGS
jgi:hemophore-related protein